MEKKSLQSGTIAGAVNKRKKAVRSSKDVGLGKKTYHQMKNIHSILKDRDKSVDPDVL